MKRIIIFLLCFLLTAMGLFMAACQPVLPQTSPPDSSSTTQGPTNSEASTPDTSPTTQGPTNSEASTPDTSPTTQGPTNSEASTPDSSSTTQGPTNSETSTSDSNPSQQEPIIHYTNIPYGAHPLQTMDIYIPKGSQDARYPVVLTLHGGEWMSGDKAALERYTATILASDCIHVNMNYRLLNDGISADAEAPYEEMLNDIEAAFDFLAQNAEAYQIDTSKAAIAGYSSGGHLALLYAYTRTDTAIPIHFVISEAGPTNFLDPKTFTEDWDIWLHESHNGHGDIEVWPNMTKAYRLAVIGAITGVEYGEPGWEEAWEKASPAYAVTASSPKTFLFYGSHDAAVPMSHAELLESNHPDCSLYEILDATHDLYADPMELQNFYTMLSTILEGF